MGERTFGHIIRELRTRRGKIYSMSKVARDLTRSSGRRIAVSTLASWETDRALPDMSIIKYLAQYYHVSTDYLLGLEKDHMTQDAFNPAARRLRGMVQNMNDRSKDLLEKIYTFFEETMQEKEREREELTFSDPVDYYDLLIKASIKLEDRGEDTKELRILFLQTKGEIFQSSCNYRKALECYEEAYDLSTCIPRNGKYRCTLLKRQGNMELRMGYYRRAEQLYEKALEYAHNDVERAELYSNLATVEQFLGYYGSAVHKLEKSYRLFKACNSDSYNRLYTNLGILYAKTGNYKKALDYFGKAYEWALHTNDLHKQSLNKNGMGVVYEKMGAYNQAEKEQRHSLKLALETGNKLTIAQQQFNLGVLERCKGNLEESLALITKALQQFEEMKDIDRQAEAHVELAKLFLLMKNMEMVSYHLDYARSYAPRVNDPDLDIELNVTLSKYQINIHDYETAFETINKAAAIAEKYGLPAWECYAVRVKLCFMVKNDNQVFNDLLKCEEIINKLEKNIPDKYRSYFRKKSEIREILGIMNKCLEKQS